MFSNSAKIVLIFAILFFDLCHGCAGLFGGGGGGGCCCQSACGRKKRSIDEDERREFEFRGIASKNEDLLCNSPEMKAMIQAVCGYNIIPKNIHFQHMKSNPQASSKSLQSALEDHDSHRYVVVCSEVEIIRR